MKCMINRNPNPFHSERMRATKAFLMDEFIIWIDRIGFDLRQCVSVDIDPFSAPEPKPANREWKKLSPQPSLIWRNRFRVWFLAIGRDPLRSHSTTYFRYLWDAFFLRPFPFENTCDSEAPNSSLSQTDSIISTQILLSWNRTRGTFTYGTFDALITLTNVTADVPRFYQCRLKNSTEISEIEFQCFVRAFVSFSAMKIDESVRKFNHCTFCEFSEPKREKEWIIFFWKNSFYWLVLGFCIRALASSIFREMKSKAERRRNHSHDRTQNDRK